MATSVDISGAVQKLTNIEDMPDRVMDRAYKFFVNNTPYKTGNAQRNTDLVDHVIEANYPYAKRLDEGYSRQAPRGMTKPTLKEIERLVRQEIKKGK